MAQKPALIAALVALPVAVLAGVLVFWLLGGFPGDGARPQPEASGPVQTDAPALDERAATVCRALVAQLPETLGGRQRRPVTAGSEQNAAFGDPPIVVSCGVARPAVAQDAQLVVMSGVCWWAQEQRDGAVWTTVDREIPVRATVPKPATGDWVVNLSPGITATVPVADPPPVLCR